ncbi:hypothetical protein Tco_1130062, partial [Tanacetum coccineum]
MIPSLLLLPSPTHRDIIPKVDMPLRKRARFAALSHRFEIRESSTTATTRQPGVYFGPSHDIHVHHQDAQEDMVVLQAHVASLEREAQYLRTKVITIDKRDLQLQRRDDVDRVTRLMGRIKDLEDKMSPKKNTISVATIEDLITQRVTEDLAAQDTNRNSGNGNDNRSHDSGSGGRRTPHTARWCTYKEFLNCQPLNFKGTKGAVGLAHWFEKMESVFHINNCTVECQVKMLPEESDNVEKYIGGLPDNIQGNVMSARPKTLQEAIKLANDLMDQKVRAYVERQTDNKRRLDNNPRDNHVQQPPYKRQNVARAYTA